MFGVHVSPDVWSDCFVLVPPPPPPASPRVLILFDSSARYFRSQTLLHLQTIDQLNKDVRVNREEHSAALQHTERESERERARHLQREQELLTLLSAQEQRNSDLMHQLRAAQQQLEQTGAAAPPAIADTDRDEHVADAAPVDAATTKLPQAGLARDPEPESERENNAANVEVAEAF